METCGLVSLGALSGTPVVGSTFGHELEYLEGDACMRIQAMRPASDTPYYQRCKQEVSIPGQSR